MSIPEQCPVKDCAILPHNRKSLGYCTKHWAKYKKYGDATYSKYTGVRLVHHPSYGTWKSMKQRCYDPNHVGYVYYGEKGITVCDRWQGIGGFQRFLEDMGEKPSTYHTLDRIDPSMGYTPENCRWATPDIQAANIEKLLGKPLGVRKQKSGKWKASMKRKGKFVYIGTYETKEEAIKQRNAAALSYIY